MQFNSSLTRFTTIGMFASFFLIEAFTMAWARQDDLFVPVNFQGIGGNDKFQTTNFSYFCNIMEIATADMDNDGDQDLILLAGNEWVYTTDDHYAPDPRQKIGQTYKSTQGWLEPGDYLYGRDPVDADSVVEVSPNIKSGLVGDPLGRVYTGSDLAWMENDGSGNFTLRFITPGNAPAKIYQGLELELADLDEDGDPDIIVWNRFSREASNCNELWTSVGTQRTSAEGANRIAWLENRRIPDGTVTFVDHTISESQRWGPPLPVGSFFRSHGAIGDFDNDGNRDVLVGDKPEGGYGPSDFENSVLYYHPGGVAAAGDFNNTDPARRLPSAEDGSSVRGLWTPAPNNATFSGWQRLPSYWVNTLLVTDFDGDGWDDILLGAGCDDGRPLAFLRNNRSTDGKSFGVETIPNNPQHRDVQAIAVGDINRDGLMDLVTGGGYEEEPGLLRLYLTRNNSFVSWQDVLLSVGDEFESPVDAVVVRDLNNDGLLDILAAAGSNRFSNELEARGKDSLVIVFFARHVDGNGNSEFESSELRWEECPLVESSPIPDAEVVPFLNTADPNVQDPFLSNDSPPNAGRVNATLAVADFDGDGSLDVFRSTRHAPLALFKNVINAHRRVRIQTKTQGAVFSSGSVDFLSVQGSSTTLVPIDKPIGKGIGNP